VKLMAQNNYYNARQQYAYGNVAPRQQYVYGNAAPRQQYVYGNAVPKEDYRPERYERDERARERNAAQQKSKKAALRMDLPYLIMLTVAAIAALFICVNYLQVQAQITASIKNIETQEKILEELRTDNDALESRIDAGINLDEIYRVATADLGMVYANKDQVVTYDRTPTEYVRQNEDIAK